MPRQALAAVEKQACDVALVDINLPGRGGLELLQDLRRLYPKMPVIVLSAYPERDYAPARLQARSGGLCLQAERRGGAALGRPQGAHGRALRYALAGRGAGGPVGRRSSGSAA